LIDSAILAMYHIKYMFKQSMKTKQRIEKEIKLVPVILVVYKAKSGLWRGFCTPYDVACVSDTKEDAKQKLITLVKLYEDGLEKYHNPKHLVIKELSDEDDINFFRTIVWPKVSKKIQERMFNSYLDYIKQQEIANEHKFTTYSTPHNTHSLISYSQRPLAFNR
jgi:hypothetical protein